jgi:5-enolpyruvylshikimate-3-phosphate synthase
MRKFQSVDDSVGISADLVADGGWFGGGITTPTVTVPGDKSVSHRALLAALLPGAPARLTVRNANMGGAVRALLPVMRAFGRRVTVERDGLTVERGGEIVPQPVRPHLGVADWPTDVPYLDTGSSSAAARLLIGLLAGTGITAVVDGDAVLRHRPMDWLVDPLNELGAEIAYLAEPGRLPVVIRGQVSRPGAVDLTVGSAQARTAALLAVVGAGVAAEIRHPVRSRDHTERMLSAFGVRLTESAGTVRHEGGSCAVPEIIEVPGDPSLAAHPVAARLLWAAPGELTVPGVCLNPTRLGFFETLRRAGVDIGYRNARTNTCGEPVGGIVVRGGLGGAAEPQPPQRVAEALRMTTPSRSPDLAARVASLTSEQRARIRDKVARLRSGSRLTPGQLWLWNTHRLVGGRPVDVVCQAVHLTGARVDLNALAERIHGFVQAHEALRTTFEEAGSVVRPVVHARLPSLVTRVRCPDETAAHALARELAHEPFDPENGPLFRAVLAEGASADDAWLLIVVHNLVFDAWSFELPLDELGRTDGATPPAPVPFSRFAAEQARWVGGEAGRAAAAYWTAEAAAPPPRLPTDRPRPTATARTGRRVAFALSGAVGGRIADSARREAATAYTGWLAVAWAMFVEFGGREDVLLGTFTAGRDLPGAETTVGYLLNVLPVRLRASGDGTHAARVRAARDAVRTGLGHAAYPGELIAVPPRVPGTQALFDAAFVFDNLGAEPRGIQGADTAGSDVDKGTARYDLTLAVYPGPDGVSGWLEYDAELYEENTARRLVGRFTELAEQAAR